MQTPPHATRAQLVTFLNLANERALLALLKSLGLAGFGRTVPWPRVWEAIGLQGDQPAGLHASLMSPLLTATDLAADFGVSAETVHRARREGREGMPPALLLGPRKTRWLREEIRAWQGLRPDPGYRRLTAPVSHPPIAQPLRFGALPGAPGPRRPS